jgi:hypothetical protein
MTQLMPCSNTAALNTHEIQTAKAEAWAEAVASEQQRVADTAAWLEMKLGKGELDSAIVIDAWGTLGENFLDHNEDLLKLFLIDREAAKERGRVVAITLLHGYVSQNLDLLWEAKKNGFQN